MWRAYAGVGQHTWREAKDMPGAQVAAVDYAPGGWPEASYTTIRRVRIDAKAISAPTRSRRRRTIDPDQGEQGKQAQTVRDVLAWFRRRTDFEESR